MKLSLLIVAVLCVHVQGKGLRQVCPQPKCKPVPNGCKHYKLSGMKNPKTGCLMFPCGLTKCPKPQKECPIPRCPNIPKHCAWVKVNFKTAAGCPKYPCGILQCKTVVKPEPLKCPTPMCAPAKNGCKYEKSDEKNAHGCPKYPCGILKCDQQTLVVKPEEPKPEPKREPEEPKPEPKPEPKREPEEPKPEPKREPEEPKPEPKRDPEPKREPEETKPEPKREPEETKPEPKREPEEPRRICCMAMTKSCLACKKGISVDEFCKTNAGRFGCKESDKPEPEPKREPEEPKPEAESKEDISTNLCSSPVEFYSDCDYSNKLEAGKVGVHSLEAKNIKGMVVPRGCRVQLFSKSTFSHSFTSKHPSHGLVTVGPTRVCLKNKLDPVAYDISHNANVAALVNAIKEQDIKGGRLERHVEELTTSQKSQGAELRRLRSEVDKLKSSK